ncbi:MAG: hypothetical protein ACE367_01905 [Acidimicrobiales bacterium]
MTVTRRPAAPDTADHHTTPGHLDRRRAAGAIGARSSRALRLLERPRRELDDLAVERIGRALVGGLLPAGDDESAAGHDTRGHLRAADVDRERADIHVTLVALVETACVHVAILAGTRE